MDDLQTDMKNIRYHIKSSEWIREHNCVSWDDVRKELKLLRENDLWPLRTAARAMRPDMFELDAEHIVELEQTAMTRAQWSIIRVPHRIRISRELLSVIQSAQLARKSRKRRAPIRAKADIDKAGMNTNQIGHSNEWAAADEYFERAFSNKPQKKRGSVYIGLD